MEKTIQEKLDYYRSIAKRAGDQRPACDKPAKPDSLSTVIRTQRDADLFMAQLDAVTQLARREYLERKEKGLEE